MNNTAVHIAHLINPILLPPDHELAIAQQYTFESMRVAASQVGPDIKIELLTAQFPEDIPIIPSFYSKTTNLAQSVLDCQQFTHSKKLPLLHDLISRLYHESNAEFLIYTNVDIGLQPDFYLEIAKWIRQGLDAFIINRRRISSSNSETDLPTLYKQRGLSHPGFDCFVFHRSLYPKFKLGKVCIGVPFVEIVFSQNLFCYARNFHLFDKEYLTFHLGMEVFKKRDPEYLKYNRREYYKAIRLMWPDLDNRKFPWGDQNILYRIFRWGLHPAIPISLCLRLELRRLLHRRAK